jgi:hypothetical protein
MLEEEDTSNCIEGMDVRIFLEVAKTFWVIATRNLKNLNKKKRIQNKEGRRFMVRKALVKERLKDRSGATYHCYAKSWQLDCQSHCHIQR